MAKSNKLQNTKSGPGVGALPLELFSAEPDQSYTHLQSVLVFDIEGKRFGIGVEHTEGVVDCPRISPLPSAPDGLIGVASVRGRMTLVIDLSLATELNRAKRRLILLKGEAQLGLIADHVEGVLALEPESLLSKSQKGEARANKSKMAEETWPARAYFKSESRHVPVLDIERLADI
jgi:chemotaxis signal transduction protein